MDALSAILLLAGLLLALGAPRIRWQRVRVHGPWWGYRALSRTGQLLLTIHGELLAGALIGWGISGLVPGDLGKVFTLVGGACLILNIVMLLLVTGPLMLVGVATERPPKA